MSQYLSCSGLAKILGVTQRRVQQLAKEDIIPKAKRGQYDWIACVQNYCKHLRERAEGRRDESQGVKSERERYNRAQADKCELEIAIMRRDLLPADEVQAFVADMAVNCRTNLMALPSKISAQLALFDDAEDIRLTLEREIREALEDISEYVPQADAS